MHRQNLLPTFSFLVVVVTTLTLFHIPKTFCQYYAACGEPFRCGGKNFGSYPFWGGSRPSSCGHPGFQLDCQNTSVPFLEFESVRYRVLDIDGSRQSLTVARDDLWNDICPRFIHDTTFNYTNFRYSSGFQNVTLYYDCTLLIPNNPIIPRQPNQFDCPGNNSATANTTGFYLTFGADFECSSSISVPVNQAAIRNLVNSAALQATLRDGFGIEWEANNSACDECTRSGGRCGHNSSTSAFVCFCPDQSYNLTCGNIRNDNGGNGGVKTPVSIGLAIAGAVIAGIGLGWLIIFCRQRRKRLVVAAAASSSQIVQTESKELPTTPLANKASSAPSDTFTKSISSYPSTKSEFGRNSSYFGVQVFNYHELEEATDNFSQSRELGDGGFGTVYYGILPDGRIVAVKRLYENNFKRVEQFMNEVEILTRLRHTNLVTLYGCTSKRSRELLLVYEYIPNGTVADHLHGNRSKSGLLSWPIRLNIAIETAEALAYLHASDIIHRDVKTNNILLDNDFHVKVADFGLSRLFPNDVTHVSTAPQGTPGYVDPEYYQCYQLTEKSDVYSFGVVLIELLSSLQAVDTNRHRQDINLANMGINKIQNHTLHELVDPSLDFGTNSSARRMMTQVSEIAFRCLQQERDMRPSMQEVVDVLRRIQKEGLNNAHKVGVVDILIDDGGHVKDKVSPPSPDSVADKWASNSTPTSSG